MKFRELVAKAKFGLQKHSPEICVGLGIVSGIAATVFACKATLKVDEVLTDAKDKLDRINTVKNDPDVDHRDAYTEEDAKKDKAIVYAQTGLKLAKLYAIPVALGVASVSLIIGGHKVLKKRYLGVSAAYAALDKAFGEYRDRVKEQFGEETEYRLKNGIKVDEIEVTEGDGNGNETTEKITYEERTAHGAYTKIFDAASRYWEKDSEYNLMFLRKVQSHFNDRFRAEKGVIFLNEVYKALDIPITKEGQIIGWAWDSKRPFEENYIDFGIYEPKNARFVNGYEPCVWLDFNVDGNVWEKMC